MKFEDTELLKDPAVEKAFNFAQSYVARLAGETKEAMADAVREAYEDELYELEEARDLEEVSKDEYQTCKNELDDMLEKNLSTITPEAVGMVLHQTLLNGYVGPAMEIQRHSDKPVPALIAAALVADCVRDPVDCKKVEEAFNPAIAGLAAELAHINAYPADSAENTLAASPDAKRLMLAQLCNAHAQRANAAIKAGPEGGFYFSLSEAKETLEMAGLLFGEDKKLEARLVDVFNHANIIVNSPFRFEVRKDGALELTKGPPKRPDAPKPDAAKNPSPFLGDDGF